MAQDDTPPPSPDAEPKPAGGGFLRGLAAGLAAIILIGAATAGFLWLKSDDTQKIRQDKLASQTVLIERPAAPAAPPAVAMTGFMGPVLPEPQTDTVSSAPPEENEQLPGPTEIPVPGLFETTADGKLPVRRTKDGLTPFAAYRRPFDRFANDKPVVSIAVADLGLSARATEAAIKTLPPAVSLALSPYASDMSLWINEARADGHEVWLMLPLEGLTYPENDPGPHTILVSAPERENQMKLSWVLGRAAGYAGFITTGNPVLMDATNDMRPVIGNIFTRGLGLIDTSESASMVAQTMALGQNAPYAKADIMIDRQATREDIRAALAELEQKARTQGSASGIIQPLPVSYQEVLRWIETLPQKGLTLAPLSAQTGQ